MKDNYRGRYDDLVARFGTPWYFIHRVDLHTELKRLAQNLAVNIRLGSEVRHVDCDTGILTLANGQSLHKDLVVAADGVHVNSETFLIRQFPDAKHYHSLNLLPW
jgi:salicylate hydroxylase